LTKYIEKNFSLRVRKKDGRAKLVVGVIGVANLGKVIKIPVGKDDVLMAKIIAKPKTLDEPWEAKEI
jgi:hypothetical protein